MFYIDNNLNNVPTELSKRQKLGLEADQRIQSYINQHSIFNSEEPFFSTSGYNFWDADSFQCILSHLESPNHNYYLSPLSTKLAALTSVSKRWNKAIHQKQDVYRAKYQLLKEQEALTDQFGSQSLELFKKGLTQDQPNTANINRALNYALNKTIDLIIEKQLEVANLKSYGDLTDALLEKLLQGSPNLKHLIISSELITKMPACCGQLQTLECCCGHLKSLPACLTQLTYLDCSECYSLKSLPNMPELTILECEGCEELKLLPDLPKLMSLNCEDAEYLKSIQNLPNLTYLNCCECPHLKILADLPKLIYLNCSDCGRLNNLPPMPHLLTLETNGCYDLNIQPEFLHKDCRINGS